MTIIDTTICGDCGGANGEHRVACSKYGKGDLAMTETCDAVMSKVPGGFMFCNAKKGHLGMHSHTFPHVPLPTTAEQTVMGMFNALADQIRALHGLMHRPLVGLDGEDWYYDHVRDVACIKGRLYYPENGRLRELTDYCQVTAELVTKLPALLEAIQLGQKGRIALDITVAQMIAHRACCGVEHDPANGKLHGYCVICGVPWPCEYVGPKPIRAKPQPSGKRAKGRK